MISFCEVLFWNETELRGFLEDEVKYHTAMERISLKTVEEYIYIEFTDL